MVSVKKNGEGVPLPSLKQVVSALAPRRKTLNNLDLQLVEALKRVEDRLRAHISTRVSTELETRFEEGAEWCEELTFGKLDGKWQLLIESGLVGDPEIWKAQPLVTSSRERRVQVLNGGFLEKLVHEAVAQLDAQIAEREAAIKMANNLADVLGSVTEAGE